MLKARYKACRESRWHSKKYESRTGAARGGPVKSKLKPGDTVRVVGERGTAKIRSILTSMHGVLLEKRIGRFRNWNLDEIRLVKRG